MPGRRREDDQRTQQHQRRPRFQPSKHEPGGERAAKYNQLMRIEEQLGEHARYAGRAAVAVR